MKATVTELHDVRPEEGDKKFAAVIDSIKDLSLQIIADSPNIPSEASFAINNIKSDSFIVNFVSSNMSMASVDKQKDFGKQRPSQTSITLLETDECGVFKSFP